VRQADEFCPVPQIGAQYVILPKDLEGGYDKTSTTEILSKIRAPTSCPLRVDFAGVNTLFEV
jgi:hypothetical protein